MEFWILFFNRYISSRAWPFRLTLHHRTPTRKTGALAAFALDALGLSGAAVGFDK